MYTGKWKEAALTSLKSGVNKAGKPIDVEHADGGGLYLVATASGRHRCGSSIEC